MDADPFPDPNLTEPSTDDDDESDRREIKAIIDRTRANGFPPQLWQQLHDLVREFASTFSTRFSSKPFKVDPLRIELTPDAKPIRVRLRN